MGLKDFAGNVLNAAEDLSNKAQNIENKVNSTANHMAEAPVKMMVNKINRGVDQVSYLTDGVVRTPLEEAFDELYSDEQAMVKAMDVDAMREAYKANNSSKRLMKYYKLYISHAEWEEELAAEEREKDRKRELAAKYKKEALEVVKDRLCMIKADVLKEMNEALSSAGYSTYADDSSVAADFLEKSNDASQLDFSYCVAKSDEFSIEQKEKLLEAQIKHTIMCEAEKACYDSIVMFVYKNDKGNAAVDKIHRVREFSNNSFCKKYGMKFDSKMYAMQQDYFNMIKPKKDFIHLGKYKKTLKEIKKDPFLEDWNFYEVDKDLRKIEKLFKVRKVCLIVVAIVLVILLLKGIVAGVNKANSNKVAKAVAMKQLANEKYLESVDKEAAPKTATGKNSTFKVKNVEFGGKLKDVLVLSKDGATITVNDDMSISYAVGIEFKKELLVFLAYNISVNGLEISATPGLLGVEEYEKSDFSSLYETISKQLESHWKGDTIVLEFTVENPELFGGAVNPVLRTEKERSAFAAKMANKKKLVISAE